MNVRAMDRRMTAILVCLALASAPVLAREAKVHKPIAQAERKAAHKTTRKATAKKPAGKKAPAAIATAYAAMPADERLAIQSDLAWLGDYEGAPGGDFDDQRVIDAVKLFQKASKGKDTGILDEQESARTSPPRRKPSQQAVGWQRDRRSGNRGALRPAGEARVAARLLPHRQPLDFRARPDSDRSFPPARGEPAGAVRPRRRRRRAGAPSNGACSQPNSFVISGTQGLKNFVVRAEASGGEVRGITILYDQATAGIMAPVAVAMANSFQGFPDPNAGPPPGQRARGRVRHRDRGGSKRRSHRHCGRSRPTARPSRCRVSAMPSASPRTTADDLALHPALWRAQSRAGGARRRKPRRRPHARRHRRPGGAGRRRRGDKSAAHRNGAKRRAGAEAWLLRRGGDRCAGPFCRNGRAEIAGRRRQRSASPQATLVPAARRARLPYRARHRARRRPRRDRAIGRARDLRAEVSNCHRPRRRTIQ